MWKRVRRFLGKFGRDSSAREASNQGHFTRRSNWAKQRSLFDIADSLLGLSHGLGDRLAGLESHSAVRHCALTLLASAQRSYLASVLLCREGLAFEAAPQSRRLFEILVSIHYILIKPAQRVLLFNDVLETHALLNHLKMLEFHDLFVPDIKIDKNTLEESLEKVYCGVREMLSAMNEPVPNSIRDLRKRLSQSWALVPFEKMYRDVVDTGTDQEKELLTLYHEGYYRQDCDFTHGGSGYRRAIAPQREGVVRVSAGPSEAGVGDIMWRSSVFFLDIIRSVPDLLSIPLTEQEQVILVNQKQALLMSVSKRYSLHNERESPSC